MSEHTRNSKSRMSGILAHPTSFPSPYGIGDLGQNAYDFIDFLCKSGQTLWQVLPLGPTGYGDSPYQSFSSFAGQFLLISPDILISQGLLTQEDTKPIPDWYKDRVDYGYVIHYKTNLYKKAFENFKTHAGEQMRREYQDFCQEHAHWLNDYTLFMACKDFYGGKCWLDWDDDIRNSEPEAKARYSEQLRDSVDYYKFLQFEFFQQWFKLKAYANDRNIFIVGDIPIFVALDSSDAWANKKYFQLDSTGHPTAVSGVPPDYFSTTGQLWGNPLYDWNELKRNGYKWWMDRVKHQLHLVDYLRIDHFRGFEAYWSVPYGEETAVNGHWEKGPFKDFFFALQNALGENLPIFAEDLGVITADVETLRDDFNLPGMKVLQFGFENYNPYNQFLPHNFVQNCICYTGTHDNDTTLGWYEKQNDYTKECVQKYMHTSDQRITWAFIETALSSIARYAIFPIQDILSVGSEGRMNTPSTSQGNWSFRFQKAALSDKIAEELKKLTQFYGR